MADINEKLMEILKKKNLLTEEEIGVIEADMKEKSAQSKQSVEEQIRKSAEAFIKPKKKLIAPLTRAFVDGVCLGRADEDNVIAHDDDCCYLAKDEAGFICLKATEKAEVLEKLKKLARTGKTVARRQGDCNTVAFKVKEVLR